MTDNVGRKGSEPEPPPREEGKGIAASQDIREGLVIVPVSAAPSFDPVDQAGVCTDR